MPDVAEPATVLKLVAGSNAPARAMRKVLNHIDPIWEAWEAIEDAPYPPREYFLVIAPGENVALWLGESRASKHDTFCLVVSGGQALAACAQLHLRNDFHEVAYYSAVREVLDRKPNLLKRTPIQRVVSPLDAVDWHGIGNRCKDLMVFSGVGDKKTLQTSEWVALERLNRAVAECSLCELMAIEQSTCSPQLLNLLEALLSEEGRTALAGLMSVHAVLAHGGVVNDIETKIRPFHRLAPALRGKGEALRMSFRQGRQIL